MEEYKKLIHKEFEKIKAKMSRDGFMSTLYGEFIDTNDFETMVVAAYYIAQAEEHERLNSLNETWTAILQSRK